MLAVLGLIGIFLSNVKQSDDWLASVLIEIGAGLFLFAGLYWYQRNVVEKKVKEAVADSTQGLTSELQGVKQEVADIRADMAAVGEQTRESIQSFIQSNEEALTNFAENVSSETAGALLDRARELDSISPRGVRVRLPATYSWLRFQRGEDAVLLFLEERGGTRIKEWTWAGDMKISGVLTEIAQYLMRRNEYPADGSFDAAEILDHVRRTLALAIRARYGLAFGMLNQLIELPNDQWAITRSGIEAYEHGYQIGIFRLNEKWHSHLKDKTWVEMMSFEEAYETAAALFETDASEFYPYREPDLP